MLAVVTFLWGDKYTTEYVEILHAALRRNSQIPFRFFCVCDPREMFDDPRIEIVRQWPEFAGLPGCYRRLKTLGKEAGDIFGATRIAMVDLDMAIVGDVTPILTSKMPATIYKCRAKGRHKYALNPSLLVMDVGALDHVWEKFRFAPQAEIDAARKDGWSGTDQAIISNLCSVGSWLGAFDRGSGVYSFRDDMKFSGDPLPADARIVSFHSKSNPHEAALQRAFPWIAQHWRV